MDETTYTNNTNKEKFKIKLQELSTKFNEKYKARIFNSKYLIPAAVVIISVMLIVFAIKIFSSSNLPSTTNQTAQVKPEKTIVLNRNFDFPIKNDKGKEVGKLSYELTSAEIDNSIIVQGKFATAVSGKKFLVVNLKLSNNQDQGIQINTKDYIRLSVNGNTKELLAPSLHNDPVTVQSISIQYSRLGFVVASSDKNPVLIVGEIKGSKTNIPVSFK